MSFSSKNGCCCCITLNMESRTLPPSLLGLPLGRGAADGEEQEEALPPGLLELQPPQQQLLTLLLPPLQPPQQQLLLRIHRAATTTASLTKALILLLTFKVDLLGGRLVLHLISGFSFKACGQGAWEPLLLLLLQLLLLQSLLQRTLAAV